MNTADFPLGRHLLLELHGIAAERLGDENSLRDILATAAAAAGATVLSAHFHHFGSGQGVTGVLLLRESHISIHTWPEYGYAAVDVFMCGEARPELAIAVLSQGLAATSCQVEEHRRGLGILRVPSEKSAPQRADGKAVEK